MLDEVPQRLGGLDAGRVTHHDLSLESADDARSHTPGQIALRVPDGHGWFADLHA